MGFAAPAFGTSTDIPITLELPEFGANTPLIKKALYEVQIELGGSTFAADVASEGFRIAVYINDVLCSTGQVYTGDTARTATADDPHVKGSDFTASPPYVCKISSLPNDARINDASSFRIKLVLYGFGAGDPANLWQGYIHQVIIKFLPIPFQKKAWGFSVRLENHQTLLDGSAEADTPATKMAAIISAKESKTPVSFTDIDGQTYTVIVSDFQENSPVIGEDSGRLEHICTVELLEV